MRFAGGAVEPAQAVVVVWQAEAQQRPGGINREARE